MSHVSLTESKPTTQPAGATDAVLLLTCQGRCAQETLEGDFPPGRAGIRGPWCRSCIAAHPAGYAECLRVRARASGKRWRVANPETVRASKRKWRTALRRGRGPLRSCPRCAEEKVSGAFNGPRGGKPRLWCIACVERDPQGYREVASRSAEAAVRKSHSRPEAIALKLAAKKRRLRAARPRCICPNCALEQSQIEFYPPGRGGELRLWCRSCIQVDPLGYQREMNARQFGLRHCPRCGVDQPPMEFGRGVRGGRPLVWCRGCVKADPEGYRRERAAVARACRHRRTARMLALPYAAVNLEQLAARDGWVCGRCGEPVDRALRWPHPMSASTGHIVRVADGGAYEPGNLRVEHLRCNLRHNHEKTTSAKSGLSLS